MARDAAGSEARPPDEVVVIDSLDPCGGAWTVTCGMQVLDEFWFGCCLVGEHDDGGLRSWGNWQGFRLCFEGQEPEVGRWIAGAFKEDNLVAYDLAMLFGESYFAAVVAEECNG